MAPRPDKVNSAVGVVRSVLAADIAANKLDTIIGVGITALGKVDLGTVAGQTGIVGIIIPTKWLSKANSQVDIFKLGDVVDCEGLAAGTKYYINPATGALTATATAGFVYAGYTVEADRLVLSGFAGVVAV